MPDTREPERPEDDDNVEEASEDSFPASDAPGWTGTTSTVGEDSGEEEESGGEKEEE